MPPETSFSRADAERLLDHDERVKEAVGHAHESFRDARIRAAFAIAPVLGPVMTTTSPAEIRIPVRIVVGSKDDQAKVVARSFCIDPGSIDRDAVHRKVGADALAFFNRAMGATAVGSSAGAPR